MPLLVARDRAQLPVAPSIVRAVHGRLSKLAREAPVVDQAGPVLEDPARVGLVVVLAVAPEEVVPVPGVAVAGLAVEPRVRLVAVAVRASHASRSGQSVKSLKCGKPRVLAASRFLAEMALP